MPDTARVLFHPMNKLVTVPRNTTVLEAIRRAEIPFESICGGKGECNKCRVVFLSGSSTAGSPASIKGLTPEEVRRNYCRACQTLITGNCEFAARLIPHRSHAQWRSTLSFLENIAFLLCVTQFVVNQTIEVATWDRLRPRGNLFLVKKESPLPHFRGFRQKEWGVIHLCFGRHTP